MKEAEKAELNTITAKSTFTATPEQQEADAQAHAAAQEYNGDEQEWRDWYRRVGQSMFGEELTEYMGRCCYMAGQCAGHAAGKQEAERWWAERYKALGYLTAYDGEREKQILAELDAKAKEMLG